MKEQLRAMINQGSIEEVREMLEAIEQEEAEKERLKEQELEHKKSIARDRLIEQVCVYLVEVGLVEPADVAKTDWKKYEKHLKELENQIAALKQIRGVMSVSMPTVRLKTASGAYKEIIPEDVLRKFLASI